MTDYEDNQIWVIKDSNGHYCHANSIHKIEKDVVAYIRYCSFGEECGGYTIKERALKALGNLNIAKEKYGFNVEFHLEQADPTNLANEHLSFSGKNMILTEKHINITHLSMRRNKIIAMTSVLLLMAVGM